MALSSIDMLAQSLHTGYSVFPEHTKAQRYLIYYIVLIHLYVMHVTAIASILVVMQGLFFFLLLPLFNLNYSFTVRTHITSTARSIITGSTCIFLCYKKLREKSNSQRFARENIFQ